jgi:hypothetical protein
MNTCKANCNGKCRGEVKSAKVFWPDYSYCFGTFHYCERAIEMETSKGNIVEFGPPPLEEIPERTTAIYSTACAL